MLYANPVKLEDQIKILVDRQKNIIIFVIEMDDNCQYLGINVKENGQDEEKYLFTISKDGNKRGNFMTGLIKFKKVNELKNAIKENEKRNSDKAKYYRLKEEFKQKQILWIEHQKILTNKTAHSKIPIESLTLLKKIVLEVVEKQDQIMEDISQKIVEGNYESILLTYKIGDKYLNNIEGFPLLFKMMSFEERIPTSIANSNCLICNNKAYMGRLKGVLPFYSIDKLNFIPDGIEKNSAKSFPLCEICALKIIAGYKYIYENLNFRIPDTYNKTELSFLLIPQLNDNMYIKEYLSKFNKNLSSFKELFEISQAMKLVSEFDFKVGLSDLDDVSHHVLTYIALFYTYDIGMKLIVSVDGIYPQRLKELRDVKYDVDNIACNNGNPVRFYFGLLIDFLEYYNRKNFKKTRGNKDKPGWIKTMSHIMNCIFTSKKIDQLLISRLLLFSIKSSFYDENIRNLEGIKQIIFKATIILEYFFRLNILQFLREPQSLSTAIFNNQQSYMFSINDSKDENIQSAKNFLDNHSGIIYNKDVRAICAIGIMVGIVIKSQQKYLKTNKAPFFSRLNQLDMDLNKIIDLPRIIWPKLRFYKADIFENLFTYLADKEISNLDIKAGIKKEIMNLGFVIGMAHGFTIFTDNQNRNAQDNKEES